LYQIFSNVENDSQVTQKVLVIIDDNTFGIEIQKYIKNLNANGEECKQDENETWTNKDNVIQDPLTMRYPKIFVYGKQVDDFLTVDKTRFGLLSLGAVKELNEKVESQQLRITQLEQENLDLKDQIALIRQHLGI